MKHTLRKNLETFRSLDTRFCFFVGIMDNILLNLPSFNGSIEVGVACGVDPGLGDNDKLKVLLMEARPGGVRPLDDDVEWEETEEYDNLIYQEGTLDAEKTHDLGRFPGADSTSTAFVAAALMYAHTANEPDTEIRSFKTRVAYGAVLSGLISFEDGDAVRAPAATAMPNANLADVAALLTLDAVSMDLSIAVSTKVGIWAMNHHVGSGKLQGYPLKVLMVKRNLSMQQAQSQEWTSAMHMVGHWLSTKITLSALGIDGIDRPANILKPMRLDTTDDLKLRVSAPPAGTHKHAIAVAIAKRLAKHCIAPLAHVLSEMGTIKASYDRIMAAPVKYHIGARYLCGERAEGFSDDDACTVLGRLSTFALVFLPGSTLCKSPHVNDIKYEDYDAIWKSTLGAVKGALAKRDPTFANAFITLSADQSAGLTDDQLRQVNEVFDTTITAFNPDTLVVERSIKEVRSEEQAEAGIANFPKLAARIKARVRATKDSFVGNPGRSNP